MNQDTEYSDLTLVWCSPHPNHYNSYLFDHLAILKGLHFEAVYFAEKLAHYPWESSIDAHYPVSYLHKTLGIDTRFLLKRWSAKKELLVIAGWNEPTMILLLLFLTFTRRKFIVVSDTPRAARKGVREYIRTVFLKRVFNSMYRFFVTGKPGIERAKLLGIQQDKLVNFPFATNTNFFAPVLNKDLAPVNSFVFISSGRLLNSHKGYDISIQAFYKLKQTHPHLAFQYILAGEGPDRAVLEQLIHTYNLTNEVHLIGWLELKDLLPFYHSGDVFVHPSHEDPFPNAVLEAMSCGLPVIGSDAAGSVMDRIENGKNGYHHKDGDVTQLYEQLLKVMHLPKAEFEKMSRLARETALQWNVSYHQQVIQEIAAAYHQEL